MLQDRHGLIDHADQIDVLSPAWFHANANGMLYGNDSPAVTQFAKAHGIKVDEKK